MQDMNSVALVARLVRDPELRSLSSGQSLASLRVAFNTSRKNGSEWEDVGNFIDVTVWGAQAESLARNLTKGQRIGIAGRLGIREYTDKEGSKRQSAEITANTVQYLDPKADRPASSSAPSQAAPGPVNDDDIPF